MATAVELVLLEREHRHESRELSWLDFDTRILELAGDESVPLLDRVFLCSIVSSNLDEFFAVRVAGLHDQVAAGIARPFPDGRTPAQTLAQVRERVLELQRAQDELWLESLQPALAAA